MVDRRPAGWVGEQLIRPQDPVAWGRRGPVMSGPDDPAGCFASRATMVRCGRRTPAPPRSAGSRRPSPSPSRCCSAAATPRARPARAPRRRRAHPARRPSPAALRPSQPVPPSPARPTRTGAGSGTAFRRRSRVYPGAAPADEAQTGPVTAIFAVEGQDARTIAAWMQAELEHDGYRTESLNGPLEDGSFVLNSVRRGGLPGRGGRGAVGRPDDADHALWGGLPEPLIAASPSGTSRDRGALTQRIWAVRRLCLTGTGRDPGFESDKGETHRADGPPA